MHYHEHVKIPPWSTPELWREAQAAIAAAVARHANALAPAVDLARRIEQGLTDLDVTMDNLCAVHCPKCADNCCRRATVWYEFKDLLFLRLNNAVPGTVQIVKTPGRPCPYLGARGCCLQRTARPFICTWYICPDLLAHLRLLPAASADALNRSLSRLKRQRREMESAFIRAIMP